MIDRNPQRFGTNDFVKVVKAIGYANRFFAERLPDLLVTHPAFDYSKDDTGKVTGSELLDIIQDFHAIHKKAQIEVYGYRSGWWHRKVIGYFKTSRPNRIHLNTRHLGRTTAQVTGTIVHEAIHVIDCWHRGAYFGHGSNSARGKHSSAPYSIGNLAQGWVEYLQVKDGRLVTFDDLEQAVPRTRRPLYAPWQIIEEIVKL